MNDKWTFHIKIQLMIFVLKNKKRVEQQSSSAIFNVNTFELARIVKLPHAQA